MKLEELYNKLKILKILRKGLVFQGNHINSLSYITGQIKLLEQIINKENISELDEYMKNTDFAGDFNIIKKVNRGIENIVSIKNSPHEWFLYVIDKNEIFKYEKSEDYDFIKKVLDESRNKGCLVLETEKPENVRIKIKDEDGSIVSKDKIEYKEYILVFSKMCILNRGAMYLDNKWQ